MAIRTLPGLENPFSHSQRPLPPLENGDRLSRAEFERRYAAMPWLKKAELIEGEVFMGPPVHFASHAEPHARIITWTGVYRASTPGVRSGDNAAVRLDADNEPQPDVLLRLDPRVGGSSRVSDDDYIEGPPELVIEIAASSASLDLHRKRHVYRRSGVREYLVWQIDDARIGWWALREGEYQPLEADAEGVLRSEVFPGLWLRAPALLGGDLAGVLATVQRGLASPEHAAFAALLAARAGEGGASGEHGS